MPQLDPSSFVSQLFWLAVSFSLLYVVLSRVLLPRVMKLFDIRQAQIRSDLEKAEAISTEIDRIKTEIERVLRESRDQAGAIVREASHKARVNLDKQITELDHSLAFKLNEAEERMDEFVQSQQSRIIELATNVAWQVAQATSPHPTSITFDKVKECVAANFATK